nr:MAG TPA: hypothetical protein [Inoviridae sp.]
MCISFFWTFPVPGKNIEIQMKIGAPRASCDAGD